MSRTLSCCIRPFDPDAPPDSEDGWIMANDGLIPGVLERYGWLLGVEDWALKYHRKPANIALRATLPTGVVREPGQTKRAAVLAHLLADDNEPVCGICELGISSTDGYWCEIDHVTPLSRGGRHCIKNLQLAHRFCNQIKRRRTDLTPEVARAAMLAWAVKNEYVGMIACIENGVV